MHFFLFQWDINLIRILIDCSNSEVSIRGVLSSITTFTMTGGSLIVFILGNLTQWRNIALYCFVLQVAITIALYFVSGKICECDFFYTLYWIKCLTFRYQNHRYGYYQEGARKLHLNRCNGCVDGRTAQMCNKSSNRWNDIKKQRNCVLFVNELKWNALISINSRLEKPSRNCHERKRSNHSVFWQSWVLRRISQALII